jgi:glycolate oxidase FAD binding subunit
MAVLAPTTLDELTEAVRGTAKLEIRGGGTKADMGAPRETDILDMTGFTGVVDYDPAELVLTVRAGTPLAEVQALLAENRQMLAFEPHGEEGATIGGVVTAGISGSRRVSAGGARDHLLGFTAVSGRGEIFTAGGKVVKNVTGFDLPKVMAGSWGRLAAMTELSLKVLPAPEHVATLAIRGQSVGEAARAMAQALGSPIGPAAVAFLPGAEALTLFRLEGFAPSVAARAARLVEAEPMIEADAAWTALRTLSGLPANAPLWRISLSGRQLPKLAEALDGLGAIWLADWGGALVRAAFDGDPVLLRDAVAGAGGHATLVRASPELRRTTPTFHPQPAANEALEARVRRAFDPQGRFETGRFGGHGDAH